MPALRRALPAAGILLGLTAALGASAVASESWQVFSPPGARFSIEMPGLPEYESNRHFTPIGSVRDAKWWLRAEDAVLAVETHDVPTIAASLMSAATILDQARDSVIEDEGGTPIESRDLTVQGAPAREFTYRLPAGPGETPLLERVLSVLVGSRLFVITGTTAEPAAHPAVSRFFASFVLLLGDEAAPE